MGLSRDSNSAGIQFTKTIFFGGESASVELDCVQKWKEKLPSLINGYEPRNIFNADETGTFYWLQPNKTLTFKGET